MLSARREGAQKPYSLVSPSLDGRGQGEGEAHFPLPQGERRRNIHHIAKLAVVLLIVLCAACSRVELYGNLSEEDANEMLVLLHDHGVDTQKKKEVRQNEVFYSILVSAKQVSQARELLLQNNLPHRKQLGLTGVYKEKGLIPTPDEQKARFLLALKGEIINSLERIPDVVSADAVLNVPEADEFADAETKKLKRPTASVVVRARPTAVVNQTVTEAKIQQFVANSVEGLNPRDVTVIISYLPAQGTTVRPGDVVNLPPGVAATHGQTPAVAAALPETSSTLIGLNLDDASKSKLKVYLLIFFVVLLVLSAVLILTIMKGSRMRRELSDLKEGGAHPAIEGQVMNEGPRRLGQPQRGGSSYTDQGDSQGDAMYEDNRGGEDEQQ